MKRFLLLTFMLLAVVGITAQTALADGLVPAQNVQAGQTATFEIELRNETAQEHQYDLSLNGLPDMFTTTFTQGGPVISAVQVAANAAITLALRVEVPLDTPVGRYTADFSALRDDGVAVTTPITLNVENTYAIRITSQNVNVSTFSGKEFTFDATASNTGAAIVTNLALVVDAPAKWVVRVDPAAIDHLEPGNTVDFHVQVVVPASQVAIDQPITLSLTSDQTTSPNSSLMVRVQSNPNYLLPAGLIVLVAVAGVFVYFRVKGRR
jgi:uncharacterized membrane protein